MKQFELTITVNPRRKNIGNILYGIPYGKMELMEQWNLFRDIIPRWLAAYNCEIYMRPELHKNRNVHVHAHVFVPDDLPFFHIESIRHHLNNNYGRSTFTLLSDPDRWINYMEKDKKDMIDMYIKSNWYHACKVGMYDVCFMEREKNY